MIVAYIDNLTESLSFDSGRSLQYAHGCVVCRSVATYEATGIDIPINQRVLKERVDALN